MAFCNVCFRHCELHDGQTGPCGARAAVSGRVEPLYYGRISSLALDPIDILGENRIERRKHAI